MTLAELAALAAKVEGFVQPRVCCSLCRGTSLAWGTEPCFQCGCTGWTDDNSPAALLMAVVQTVRKSDRFSRFDVLYGAALCEPHFDTEVQVVSVHGDNDPESIARAALVALLRAHGVGVDCD